MTIPTGFVKSTIQASSAASSRTRSAICSITGTVRIAFAKPPAPVVSWPMQPQASGIVSSRSRAACPPTRIWTSTKSAPSTARSRSVVSESSPRQPVRSSMRVASPPTTSSRSSSTSISASSSIGTSKLPEPRDELGRVRRAGTDDGDLHPFTPVSVTPSTNALCARKKMTMTGTITSSVAAIVRFHCTWCSERNCESPIDSTQWCGASPV